MPNPYYIRRQERKTGFELETVLPLAVQLYGLKQRGEIAEREAGLTEKEHALRGETLAEMKKQRAAQWGTPERTEALSAEGPTVIPATKGTEQEKIELLTKHAGIEERKQVMAEKENVDIQDFHPLKARFTINRLKTIGIPETHPIAQGLDQLGKDKKTTNADAYYEIKNLYVQYRGELQNLVSDDYVKKIEKNPAYSQTVQGKAQANFINDLYQDESGETVIGREFQGTRAAIERRQAGAMTARAHLVQALRPEKPGSDIGKLQEDKKRYLQEGYTADSPLIQAIDAEIQNKAQGKKESDPEIIKLINAYNAAPEDSPDKNLLMARINKLTETSGLQLRVNPDGTVELLQGPAAGKMSMKTTGAIEEKIIGGKEQLARLQSISEEFRPEYLETGTRLKAAWTGIKAKLGQNVPPEDAKLLTEFKKFQRKAIENINLYIKEITGAQMSEKEADRIRLAQADPGEKWYQGDDPITFKAKMDDVMKSTRAAVARYEYYKTKGLSDTEIKGLIKSDQAISLDDLIKRMQ